MNDNKDEVIKTGNKALAIAMSTLLTASVLVGCAASSDAATKTNSDYKGKMVVGEVTKVSGNKIIINVMTGGPNKSKDSKDTDTKSKETETKETDTSKKDSETAEITVDSDTKITESSGGPGGQPPQGEHPQGQPPQGQHPQGAPGSSDSSDSKSSDNSSNQAQPPQGQHPKGAPGSSDSSDSKSSDNSSNHGKPPQGQPPEDVGKEIKVSDIEKGDNVMISIDKDGDAETVRVSDGKGMEQQGSGNVTYTAVKTYTKEASVKGETVKSTEKDENAVLVKKGGDVTLDDMNITRNSSENSSGDNASFYGTSAAVLGTDGKTYVKNSKITTKAEGGAGIFSYGDGTVYASNDTIKTSKGSSGGIHVAGGGTLYAWDMDISTSGRSSAAIRSDRGGGKLVVDGGTYTSSGSGSPAIYSTADIAANNAKLTANGAEAVCIEGKNSVRLFDSKLTGNMPDDKQNDCTWNVILYQSMSGDSEEGTSIFEMNGGDLTAKNGGMFYTTNTSSKFILNDVDIDYADENDFFLRATGNSNARGWGKTGSNGADTDFTAISQEMEGDVIWDKISKVDFYMTDGSSLEGAVKQDNSEAGSGKGGYCNIYIDSGSTWTVTGNSKVTNLYNAGTIKDADGKTVTVKGTDGTVYVKGNSKFTITVNKYSKEDKTSKADKTTSFSNYSEEKPSQLA